MAHLKLMQSNDSNGRGGILEWGEDSCYLQIICRGTHIHLCAREIQFQILKAAHIREGTEKILMYLQTCSSSALFVLSL